MLIFSDNLAPPLADRLKMKNRKLKNSELYRLSPEEFQEAKKVPVVVVLDNIRSLNNIGSVFRTADAFLVEKIFLCGITATPPHKDIHKTALGATESVAWEYRKDAVSLIRELASDYFCAAVEQTENSIPLQEFSLDTTKSYALVFGNEVKGVSQEVVDCCQGVIEIPQLGTKHSLNIAVSAGIALWQFCTAFPVFQQKKS